MKQNIVVMVWVVLLTFTTDTTEADAYRELDWLDLLPDKDRAALLAEPPVRHEAETGAVRQPALGAGREDIYDGAAANAWQSIDVVSSLDDQMVRVPGFIVPLEYDASRRVVEFFLVPYFGACIHVPPPPPNQIIFVSVPGGFDLPSIYEPYVIEGRLDISMTHREIGISAYSLTADNVSEYRQR